MQNKGLGEFKHRPNPCQNLVQNEKTAVLGFRVQGGLRFRIQGSGFRVLGFRVLGHRRLRLTVLGCSGFREGLGFFV